MNLIRATPQVMGTCFDGVYNDKGILRFENHEAFMSIVSNLNDLQDCYDDEDIGDEGSPWAIADPVFFDFERKLGFDSLRRSLVSSARGLESSTPFNDPQNAFFVSDELLQAVLSKELDLIIGDTYYSILNESKVLEIPVAAKNNGRVNRISTLQKKDLLLGKTLGIENVKLVSTLDEDSTAKLSSTQSICTPYNGNEGDYTIFSPNNPATPLEYWFDPYVRRDGYYSQITNIVWEVYNTSGTLIYTYSANSAANSRLIITFPSSGNYQVCASIAGRDYLDSIFSIRCCREYIITGYQGNTCCVSNSRKEYDPYYGSYSRRLYGQLRSLNVGFLYSVRASSMNYNRNGASERADRLEVKLKGTMFNRNCNDPKPFSKSKSKKRRKRLVVRVLSIGKRLRGDTKANRTVSYHRAEDNKAVKDFELFIPVCP
jgi:hypothetical protein